MTNGTLLSITPPALVHGGEGGTTQQATVSLEVVPLSRLLNGGLSDLLSTMNGVLQGNDVQLLRLRSTGTIYLTGGRRAGPSRLDNELWRVSLMTDRLTGQALSVPAIALEILAGMDLHAGHDGCLRSVGRRVPDSLVRRRRLDRMAIARGMVAARQPTGVAATLRAGLAGARGAACGSGRNTTRARHDQLLSNTRLPDIRALRGFSLEKLDLSRTPVDDLSPLRGMRLRTLRLPGTGVVHLAPLVGYPLRELDISGTRISDLSALTQSKLTILRATDTPVSDLCPLWALPPSELYLSRSWVRHIQPLCHLGLRVLALDGTMIADLSPLKGGQLNELNLAGTSVSDLRPLSDMPLNALDLTNCEKVMDLRPLASCNGLEHLLIPPQALSVETLENLPCLHFIKRQEINRESMLLM